MDMNNIKPPSTIPEPASSHRRRATKSPTGKQKLAPKTAPPGLYSSSSSNSGPASTVGGGADTDTMTNNTTVDHVGRPVSTSHQSPEEYKTHMRQWHNRIGKKYRNKLNEKFEGLQAVLISVQAETSSSVGGGRMAGAATSASGSSESPGVGMDGDDDGDFDMMALVSPAAAVSPGERLESLRRRQEEEDDDDEGDGDEEGEGERGGEADAEYDDDDGEVDAEMGFGVISGSAGDGNMDFRAVGGSGGLARRPRMRRSKTINKARLLAMARKTIMSLIARRDELLVLVGTDESEPE